MLKKNIFFLPILFIVWLLAKLGEGTQKVIISSVRAFLKINLNPTNLSMNLPRKRGRPRTQPFFRFVLNKLRKGIRTTLPSPMRMAFVLVFIVTTLFVYSLTLVTLAHELPSPKGLGSTNTPLTTEFYDRKGRLLYRLYEGKNRTLITLGDLPDHLKQATIAIEDKNFYSHSGVDVFGVARAVFAYLQDHQVQGGSTITQQLVKNTLLTPDRTIARKTKEVLLAFWSEKLYSKDEILQMYFNEVPYGGPAWGIAAAAQTYFNKQPRDLNLAESAYLAGLPASPTTYSPYGANPELGKMRQKEVLRRMAEDHYVTKEQAEQAYDTPLELNSPTVFIKAPHFVMYVRQLLAKKYGEKVVSQGGLKIVTTLDLDLQEIAQNYVQEEVSKLSQLNVSNGAAMITDAKTGYILAMVGSKNYFDPNGGNFNVTTAPRQPGSSIKPVTYAAAFKIGYTPGNIILDAPVSFKNAWENYSPVNYDGKFHGPVTIRTALGSSYNIPAVKMLAMVGIPNMIRVAQDLGITTFTDPDRYGLSLTLGGGEIKMIDMMTVYGSFSQIGTRYTAQSIIKVTDPSGLVLEDNEKPEGQKVLPPAVAYLITDILADNKARTPAFGPNSLLQIPGRTVAVKTGTTDNKRDNWTFGFTPEYVVGAWVGNNDNKPMNPSLASGVTGAAPIWNRIMSQLVAERGDVAFQKPPDISDADVDGHKDIGIVGKQQKKIVTFTDPFSTYIPDQSAPRP